MLNSSDYAKNYASTIGKSLGGAVFMARAFLFKSSGPGLSPYQGHCVVFLD